MKSSKIIAYLIVILAVAWIVSGQKGAQEELVQSQPIAERHAIAKSLVEVRIRLAKAELFTDEIIVTGRTQASRTIVLKAETNGQIIDILKEKGESTIEGEPLAKIEIKDRAAKVREAEQRVRQRKIEYTAAESLTNKGYNSRVRLAQTRADLENARAALKQVRVELSKTAIIAPSEAIIFKQNIEEGDYVEAGNAVFTLKDLNPIELAGFISERRIGQITLGASAIVEMLDGRIVNATVSYISPAANEQTRTFLIEVSAENTDHEIKDGLTAKIKIPVTPKTAYKISPSILTLDDKGRLGIKIVNMQDIVEFVPVKILSDKPSHMWIEGPSSEARLITVGQEFVVPGQKVKPVLAKGEGLL